MRCRDWAEDCLKLNTNYVAGACFRLQKAQMNCYAEPLPVQSTEIPWVMEKKRGSDEDKIVMKMKGGTVLHSQCRRLFWLNPTPQSSDGWCFFPSPCLFGGWVLYLLAGVHFTRCCIDALNTLFVIFLLGQDLVADRLSWRMEWNLAKGVININSRMFVFNMFTYRRIPTV